MHACGAVPGSAERAVSRQVTVFDVRDPGEPRSTAIVGDLRDRSQVEAAVQGAVAAAVLHPVPVRMHPWHLAWSVRLMVHEEALAPR